MKFFKAFILLVLCSLELIAQTAKVNHEFIDPIDLEKYVTILASDSLEGRLTGTLGQKKAAKFIADKFQDLNLSYYKGKSYYQEFDLQKEYWGDIYIKTDSKTFYNNDKISFIGNHGQNIEKEVELVFGGYGTDEEISQISVEDRMVLVFSENLRASYYINKKLLDLGAYGVISANVENDKQFNSIKNSLGTYKVRSRYSIPKDEKIDNSNNFQQFVISNDRIKTLFGVSIFKLNQFIENNTISKCPTTTIFVKSEKKHDLISTENIVGILPGNSEKSIIISAHYDHIGKQNNITCPGADDNASGTATLLELAETFSKIKDLKYNLIFIALTAEEIGLLGSETYVNNPDFEPDKVLINLNIDMIGRNDDSYSNKDNYLYVIGTGIYPEYLNLFEKADSIYTGCYFDYKNNKKDKVPWMYNASDQSSFHEKDIPAIMFFTGLHSDYHTPSDTPDKINFEVLSNRVTLISYVIEELLK